MKGWNSMATAHLRLLIEISTRLSETEFFFMYFFKLHKYVCVNMITLMMLQHFTHCINSGDAAVQDVQCKCNCQNTQLKLHIWMWTVKLRYNGQGETKEERKHNGSVVDPHRFAISRRKFIYGYRIEMFSLKYRAGCFIKTNC